MKRLVGGVARSLRASESGFTLIEMLIVVGIIVALAAAIVPQVVQFGGKGEEGQKSSELSAVQTAMDNAMAVAGITLIDLQATTAPNKSWTALPKVGTTLYPLFSVHLRTATTTWGYCWGTDGKVTQTVDKTSTTC